MADATYQGVEVGAHPDIPPEAHAGIPVSLLSKLGRDIPPELESSRSGRAILLGLRVSPSFQEELVEAPSE
jgi:hypothetical protein